MWDCQAYGPEGLAVDALCFFAEPGERDCPMELVCHVRLDEERRRIFQLIRERAATGDPVYEYLASQFSKPEQLLGGEDDPGR